MPDLAHQLHDALGNAYRIVREIPGLWQNGDTRVQPYVAEARCALERLAGEGAGAS